MVLAYTKKQITKSFSQVLIVLAGWFLLTTHTDNVKRKNNLRQ